MASFTAGITFSDGVANDVTAAKLGALVTNATPTSGLIQDRTAETVIASNDTVLIGDASDSNNLKRITVDNLMKAEMSGNINSTSGTIQTLTSSTATITGGTFSGSVNSTTGTISTFNSTTGTIPTLVATTLITTGTGTATAPAISPTGDSNNGLFFPAADTIAVSTNGTERVRVDSSGNVGIGATSPTGKLDVQGGRTFLSANNEQFGLGVKYINTGGPVYFGASSNSATPDAVISNAGGASLATFTNAGNVGIGTTSPQSRLHSTSTSDGAQLILNGPQTVNEQTLLFRTGYHTNNSSAGFSAIGSIDTGGQGGILTLKTTAAGSGASGIPSERLRIDSSGNVGIGTTSPNGNLAISSSTATIVTNSTGSTISQYSNLVLYANSGSYSLQEVIYGSGLAQTAITTSTNSGYQIGTTSSSWMAFISNNNERMRIDPTGNCSIGTASALSKLHVHGDLTLSNTTTSTTGATGGISKPATYAGFLTVSINGTSRKIPYYA